MNDSVEAREVFLHPTPLRAAGPGHAWERSSEARCSLSALTMAGQQILANITRKISLRTVHCPPNMLL